MLEINPAMGVDWSLKRGAIPVLLVIEIFPSIQVIVVSKDVDHPPGSSVGVGYPFH